MVRIGIVTAVDMGERMARVKFPDTETDSGWLHMVKGMGIGDRAVVADVEDGDSDDMVILGTVM